MKYDEAVKYIVANYPTLLSEAGSEDNLEKVVRRKVSIDRDDRWRRMFEAAFDYFMSIGYTDGFDEAHVAADESYVSKAIEEAKRLLQK